MESFGKILKETRESKNLTLDIISRDTAISKQYLEAIEEEILDVIPGQTYVSGYIRNYANYVGCDAEYLIKLYHAKTVQESATPEDLLKIKKSPWLKVLWVFIGIIIAADLAVGGWVLFKFIKERKVEAQAVVSLAPKAPKEWTLTTSQENFRVYQGDVLVVPFASGAKKITVEGTSRILTLSLGNNTQIIELGEDVAIDVDGDGTTDINVYVSDLSTTSSSDRGAEITAYVRSGTDTYIAEFDDSLITDAAALGQGREVKVLIEDNRAYPFTFQATFRGNCLFRYQVDRADAVEKYLSSGETVVHTANNAARLWMSNANTVKLTVTGDGHRADTEIEKAGQVLVEDIRWIKEADGVYKLVVVTVD